MEIKNVGVVGCGIMGSGIAAACAKAGYPTAVAEVSEEFLKKGLTSIDKQLSRDIEKGRLTADHKDQVMANLKGTTNFSDFADCDLVIEVVREKIEDKKEVFSKLDKICPPHTILATNTSALSIVGLSTATKRPEKVVGMHFFNPVHIMKLLEVVQTIVTSDETARSCEAFGKTIGKTPIIVKDVPGFVVNRLSIITTLEAIRMLQSGISTVESIDNAVKLGLNHPVGPFELADMAGIDTLYYISCDLYDQFKDPAFAPPILLQKMFAAGTFGRKTGKGFYNYSEQK